ncbi:MAG TPA: S9 family peptidase [Thermomicrobiales bacterium]|jgi:dipeptidyl aminopeptidase/acylaminoacyl peptidase
MSDDLATMVTRLTRVGSCYAPSFSPDGSRLAFVSNLTGKPQVWNVATAGGWPDLITGFDDPVRAVEWSPDGAWLACLVAPGGGMNTQVYLLRPDGSGVRRLTDGGQDNNWLGPWTHDGTALAIASNRRDSNALDAYLVDPATGDFRHVAATHGVGNIHRVSRDGRRALLYRMASRSDDDLFLLDLGSNTEQLLTPHDGPGTFGNGRFSPDGSVVYLISNKDRDLTAFARIQIDPSGHPGPTEIVAARDDAELEAFELTDDGTAAALLWNVAGKSELDLLDLTGQHKTQPIRLPTDLVADLTFARNGHLLAFTAFGSTAPPDVWVIDLRYGSLRQATHSPHPGVDLDSLVRPELTRFRAHDGLELTAWVYRPPHGTGPFPTVMEFHGGPEGQSRPVFKSLTQALLTQGIAVLVPNVRGSSGFGKTFVNLDNGPLRYDGIRDIEACLDHAVESGLAAPGRIGIMGGSYGGYMTMAGLTSYPDRFAAGANLFGVVNFETFFAHTEPWMAAISTIEYGDPVTQRDLLRDLSPIHKLDRVTAPTLVLHGANDTNVPVVEAEQVVDGLRQRGVPVDYILFPDEGHGFLNEANRIRSDVAIARWFVTHLTPTTAEAP